jgi:hypothetical protein
MWMGWGGYLATNSPPRIIVVGGLTSNIVDSDCEIKIEVSFPMVAFGDVACWSTSLGVMFLDRRNQTSPTPSIRVFVDVPGRYMLSFDNSVVSRKPSNDSL